MKIRNFNRTMNKKMYSLLYLTFYLIITLLSFNYGYYYIPIVFILISIPFVTMPFLFLEVIIFIIFPIISFASGDSPFRNFIKNQLRKMNEPLKKLTSFDYMHKPFVYDNDDQYEPHGPNLDPRLRVKKRVKEYVPHVSDELEDIKNREISSDEFVVKNPTRSRSTSSVDSDELNEDSSGQLDISGENQEPPKKIIDKNADWYTLQPPWHKYTKEEIDIITYERPPPRKRRIKQHSDSESWESLSTSSLWEYRVCEDPRIKGFRFRHLRYNPFISEKLDKNPNFLEENPQFRYESCLHLLGEN
ncbi:hypothetical protein TUBRATIS_005220 [Tubulinosema ratisbonensis]|uniref:Uncharacterized protein n=1 Tax=Tubulinosema ratisbonensis TaxID=291195 RepID=A0A437APA4_9MICR|nr:hypothetical protein TUBRATIS_005220 [Tubulinosema ratisbonensis]